MRFKTTTTTTRCTTRRHAYPARCAPPCRANDARRSDHQSYFHYVDRSCSILTPRPAGHYYYSETKEALCARVTRSAKEFLLIADNGCKSHRNRWIYVTHLALSLTIPYLRFARNAGARIFPPRGNAWVARGCLVFQFNARACPTFRKHIKYANASDFRCNSHTDILISMKSISLTHWITDNNFCDNQYTRVETTSNKILLVHIFYLMM